MLERELLPSLHARLLDLFGPRRRFFIVTSPEIWTIWSARFLASFPQPPTVLMQPAGEQHKRMPTLERLAEELARGGADRGSVVLAFGGGVVGDIAGFLAAIYMRGIDYVQIPTTLLAQVDSSLGGKTGVNLASGKNLVGAFHHPRLVLADPVLLSTLPAAELRAGLFESVKAGLIRDPALFEFMEREHAALLAGDSAALLHVVTASVRVKAAVVAADERETGERMVLNFGHSIGHALEAATGYSKLLHGEAVGWGMRVALEASRQRTLLSSAITERALALIDAFGLAPLPPLSAAALLTAAASDKKNQSGVRRFVLLRALGDAFVVNDLSDTELLHATARGPQAGQLLMPSLHSAPGSQPVGTSDEHSASTAVQSMFDAIAPRYDLLNHVLSLNIDRLWWWRAARRFRHILAQPHARVADICCGTGDMTLALLKRRPAQAEPILAIDFSHQMLMRGAAKFQGRNAIAVEADALHLPLASESTQLLTTAFGFRNLSNYRAGLEEFHRVLASGGELGILDFSEPGGWLGKLYSFYFRRILPRIGRLLSGVSGPYAYLPTSVQRFPPPAEMLALLRAVGFTRVRWSPYSFGIAGLYQAVKA